MTSLFIAPRVPLSDPATGLCNPIWYRFFADMFAAFAAGGGTGGVLQAPNGGTGLTSYTIGDLIFASSATTLDKLHNVATGNALISGGVGFVPVWGKIGLTSHVSGILPTGSGGTGTSSTQFCDLASNVSGLLPVANGGTGAATLTGYIKGIGTSPFTASATIPGADISGNIPGNAANVTGVVAVPNGGSGATTLTGYLKGNGVGAFTASATIPGSDITGAALTKTDDTNVTLTLGGTPATALLRATSLALGWTGTLAVARGGTGSGTASGARTNLGFADGTYTPTPIGVVNITGATAYQCQYLRVGNTVTVSGRIDINASAGGVNTTLDLTLPIASNFSLAGLSECSGVATRDFGAQQSFAILANTAGDTARFMGFVAAAGNAAYFFTFSYVVV